MVYSKAMLKSSGG